MRIGIDCRKVADYGIGTYIRGLLSGLSEAVADHEFFLFAPKELWPLLPANRGFHLIEERSPHYSVRELFAVGRAAARFELDLFHATHYAIPFTSLPTVVTIHDLIHLKTPVWRRHLLAPAYARVMLRRATNRADRILVSTNAVRSDLINTYPASAPKVAITRFGIEPQFTPGEAANEFLTRYGVEAHRYLLFVGNDKPHKNLERLIRAFESLGHAGVSLLLVGGTRRFTSPGVRHAGFVAAEELPHLYRGAVALIQPSLEEGFGFPVVEAMACGTPVVISDREALREVAADAAVVADPLSVESLAGAIRSVLEDESLRNRMRSRGLERARDFSWRICAERTMELYRATARR